MKIDYAIYDCSPKAAAKIVKDKERLPILEKAHGRNKYPLDMLEVGKSIAVPISAAKEATLRNIVSKKKRKTKKRFAVLKHEEQGFFEIARVG